MNRLIKNLRKSGKELNILYVEDDLKSIEPILILFKQIFKSVTTMHDGINALKKYEDNYKKNIYYDLVITDLTMPKMDGLEFTKNVLKINKEQTIIIMSGNGNYEQLVELMNLGINYFIKKPIEIQSLETTLYKAIRYLNSEKELKEKNDKLEHANKLLEEMNNTLEEKVLHQTLSLYQRLYYDNLTKLPKRNKLIEDIQKLDPIGMLILDIKDFKDVNTVYGHDVGNLVLIEFSKILLNIALKRNCNIYHIGADEFVFLNLNNDIENYCYGTANAILSSVEKGIIVDYNNTQIKILITLNIGMSTSKENLFNNTQLALKHATKNRLPYYKYNVKDNLEDDSSKNIEIANIIKKAIEDDKIIPFFQAIYNNEKIVKYETLIRIEDANRIISPFIFLDISKKMKYYDQLTKTVIEKAFKEFQNRPEDFSINLSFEDIINNDTKTFLYEKIKEYNVSNKLVIEILESENINDFNIVKSFIRQVRSLGVKIAIDDFGSGYSNFAYLLEIEPDIIKIDGSIIKNIHIDEKSYKIAKTILDFAKKTNAKTVAEFVHNGDVYQKVKSLKVDYFQGYYLGEPKRL